MDTQESAPAVRNHGPTGDDTMQMATTLRRSTHTFLTHLFGPGLDDDRYVIERVPVESRRRDPPPGAQWVVEEGPGQGFPRDRLPERRPADEARARRDHHLHGRQLHHPRRSILGGLCCLGSYVAATLIPSVSDRRLLRSARKEFESPQHIPVRSVGVQERHQVLVLLPVAARIRFRDIAQRHCRGLHLEVDFGIDVGGVDGGMAEPRVDGIDVHAGEHQVTGGRMSQRMWRYLPPGQRRHLGRAAPDDRVDAEPGERLPAPVEEDSVICGTAVDQFDHDALDLQPKGALAHLSTLSMQGDECVASIAASDLQIAHSQLRGFRYTRSGLVEEQQDRVFDPPVPRRAIGHIEQGLHFVHGQPGHRL